MIKTIQKFLFIGMMLWQNDITAQSFQNPILAGFHPDPSICKAGDDYYLVVSSFAYYPGIPLFHSKDLLNWEQIGGVLNRPEQLDLDGAGVSRGLFAPSISYHNGTFYLVCTQVDKGGNFVVTTKDPKGPWSNPVWLPQINGIDPSLYFEGDKEWIVYNSDPPGNKSMYDGHRTIRINEFDAKSLKVTSDNTIIVNGGTDLTKNPVWIEGPHIIKKDGWYYLICAEGGTGYDHSEVVFRTKNLNEPFIPYQKNPILTQRHLNPTRKNPVTTTGHAEIFEGPDGKWWGVFLGCRPYEEDYYNTGRETFMGPVEWKDEWPVFNLGGDEVKYTYPISATPVKGLEKLNGNYFFRDEFNGDALSKRYSFLRTVRVPWYRISQGKLRMQLQPQTCSDPVNPSFVGFRQPHLNGHATVAMEFVPKSSNEKAGLLVFQSEYHYYFACQSVEDGKPVVQLYKGAGANALSMEPVLLASLPLNLAERKTLFLKAEARGAFYDFYYSTVKDEWLLLKKDVDAKFLSTKEAGGFVGCMYAMYASSNGITSIAMAGFDWFECRNNDDMYK